jgi:signal peptidase I
MVVAVLVIAVAAAAGAFRLAGGRWFIMQTPSMGTTAPVGTLVLTHPVATLSALRVGDVVTCRPPFPAASYYTHRVVAVSATGVTTRGDLNGAADPWTLGRTNVVGRAVLIVPGAGWLLLTLSSLAGAVAVTWAFTRRLRHPQWRRVSQLASSLAVTVVLVARLKPFTGVTELASTVDGHGVARISLVSTGLLPVRLTAAPGHGHTTPVVLTYGHHAMVALTGLSPGDTYVLEARLHLGWPATVLLLGGWLAVTLAAVAVVNRGPDAATSRDRRARPIP